MLAGVFIVGMYLNGQFVRRKNEFHQQRKILRRSAPLAPPLHWHVAPRFAEAHPLELPARHLAAYVR
jgi:hypothetical protein